MDVAHRTCHRAHERGEDRRRPATRNLSENQESRRGRHVTTRNQHPQWDLLAGTVCVVWLLSTVVVLKLKLLGFEISVGPSYG